MCMSLKLSEKLKEKIEYSGKNINKLKYFYREIRKYGNVKDIILSENQVKIHGKNVRYN